MGDLKKIMEQFLCPPRTEVLQIVLEPMKTYHKGFHWLRSWIIFYIRFVWETAVRGVHRGRNIGNKLNSRSAKAQNSWAYLSIVNFFIYIWGGGNGPSRTYRSSIIIFSAGVGAGVGAIAITIVKLRFWGFAWDNVFCNNAPKQLDLLSSLLRMARAWAKAGTGNIHHTPF